MKFTILLVLLSELGTTAATRRNIVSRRQGKGSSHIEPKLDPESHKFFFGKDYPDDMDSTGHIKPKFGHPYPAVQDTDAFDKDYVKDENSDAGEWKAQMTYDFLRTKIAKQKDQYKKAKEAEDETEKELEQARKKADDAAQKAADAEKRASDAHDRLANSKKKAKDLDDEKAA